MGGGATENKPFPRQATRNLKPSIVLMNPQSPGLRNFPTSHFGLPMVSYFYTDILEPHEEPEHSTDPFCLLSAEELHVPAHRHNARTSLDLDSPLPKCPRRPTATHCFPFPLRSNLGWLVYQNRGGGHTSRKLLHTLGWIVGASLEEGERKEEW